MGGVGGGPIRGPPTGRLLPAAVTLAPLHPPRPPAPPVRAPAAAAAAVLRRLLLLLARVSCRCIAAAGITAFTSIFRTSPQSRENW